MGQKIPVYNPATDETHQAAEMVAEGSPIPETVEQEIQHKGLTAPRITPADIEANIASEHYLPAGDAIHALNSANRNEPIIPESLRLLTICILVLRNGFTVTGESACASPENFNAELGRKIARQDAVRQVWPLMGYALREKLSQADER